MAGEHILVVDDDPETLRLVAMVLETNGYRVSRAADGQSALERLAEVFPDLIILDVMMPHMDGYALARYLRNDPATAAIPILMFTARMTLNDRVEGFEAGADEYLTKPIHPAELLARVGAVLTHTRAQQEIPPPPPPGRVIAFLSATPGAGATTLAASCAVALAETAPHPLILADLAGDGALSRQLGIAPDETLAGLLAQPPDGTLSAQLEAALVPYFDPLYLLLAPPGPVLPDWIDELAALASGVLIDLGGEPDAALWTLAQRAGRLVIAASPTRDSLLAADRMLREGLAHPAQISVVIICHRLPMAPLDIPAIRAGLGIEHLVTLPAAPDLAAQAQDAALPLIRLQPDGELARQIRQTARELWERSGPPAQPARGDG